MRTTMERKQTCIDESTEFLCPTCGLAAFEVVGTQWGCGDGDAAEEFLVMRCLDCLQLFYHQLKTHEPCRMPVEGDDRISLVTDILGPLPHGVSDQVS